MADFTKLTTLRSVIGTGRGPFSSSRSGSGSDSGSGSGRAGTTWTNWGGNVSANPSRIVRVRSEAELVDAVQSAVATGQRVKVVGSGHSFTSIALAPEVLIDMRAYDKVVFVDHATNRVTVQAGISLSALNVELDKFGLALANMGDIAYQSVAGAIATGTHGTGRDIAGVAAQVVGMRLIDGTGDVHDCQLGGPNDDIATFARVHLGALGVLSTVTIQCVRAFVVRAVNEPMKVERVLDALPELVTSNEHFEFFWLPHTKWALTKQNNSTTETAQPRKKSAAFINDYLLENVAFGAVCQVGRVAPSLIPRLATALPSGSSREEYSDTSYKIFASPRLVKFLEQEYSIEQAALPEALRSVMRVVDQRGFKVSFPVEVRFTPADDIPLSTSEGRASAYIAVHMTKGSAHEEYFRAVEEVLDEFGARPHWGKLHTKTADDLAPRYSRWAEFQLLRKRLDPNAMFDNDYLERVLGPR